jgi:glucose/mannose-6-phosphate isomerase
MEYSNPEKNSALDFSNTLKGKVILTYACEETLFSVALRFKAQVQENAKNLSFAGAIPEMNHNEINSFLNPPEILNKIKVILLKDRNDHPKNSKRIDAMYMILKEKIQTNILESKEADFLFRMFDLIYFLDWASFYLAIENNTEPTPIPIISELKNYIQR